jgi:hypothetical protein
MLIGEAEKLICNASFKGGLHITGYDLNSISKYTKGRILKRILKQRVLVSPVGLFFPNNYQYFQIFDKKIEQLITSGIANHYIEKYQVWTKQEAYEKFRHEFENNEAKVLTMHDLEAGFVIWMITISLAFTIYTLEWIGTLRAFLVINYVLFIFYDQKCKECKIISQQDTITIIKEIEENVVEMMD